jgi:hypothetical protein
MGPWLDVLELIALRGFLANFYFEADRPAKVYRISVVKQLTVPTSMVHAVVFLISALFVWITLIRVQPVPLILSLPAPLMPWINTFCMGTRAGRYKRSSRRDKMRTRQR